MSKVNPLKLDPTRTGMIRKRFETDIKRRFDKVKRAIVDLLVSEDALGMKQKNKSPFALNVFCPTGPGGGIDPTCSPGKGQLDFNTLPKTVQRQIESISWDSINPALRTDANWSSNDLYQRWVAEADSLMKQHSRSLTAPTTLLRGVAGKIYPTEVGEVFSDRGFFRATFDEYQASTFTTHKGTDGQIIIVKMPKGSKVLPGGHTRESEIYLPRDSKFRVVSVTKKENGRDVFGDWHYIDEVTVELVEQPLVANTRWRFLTTPEQLEAFKQWLALQIGQTILENQQSEDYWLQAYINEAHRKGMESVYDALNKSNLSQSADFYEGSKRQFLQSAFTRPVSIDRVKTLASRSFTDLQGITEAMSQQVSRNLVDGLIQGLSPREVASNISKTVDGITQKRALVLARTETIRAHAEGQLDSFEALGVEDIGVSVEWSTSDIGMTAAGYPSPCELCAPLKGIVLKVKEARGMLPRHPQCMCSFIPAGVGEDPLGTGQKLTKTRIQKAIDESIKAEIPSTKKRSLKTQKKLSPWVGAGKRISKKRTRSIVGNQLDSLWYTQNNCGIGPGGFQPGNKCAKGGGSGPDQQADFSKIISTKPRFPDPDRYDNPDDVDNPFYAPDKIVEKLNDERNRNIEYTEHPHWFQKPPGGFSPNWSDATEVTLPIKDLKSIQPQVSKAQLIGMRDSSVDSPINVVRLKDQYWVLDGNHRLVTAYAHNKSEIRALVIEYNE